MEQQMRHDLVFQEILNLSNKYSNELNNQINERIEKMKNDDNSHFLIYRVLGITDQEGNLIDIYQNKGRFLYKYAGSFLEESAFICFRHKFNSAKKTRIPNIYGTRPKTFEIDCLVGTDAHEIKWRDATTDGDHITKEHTRVQAIKNHGYTPIRVMFYYSQREQAKRIQETLRTLYDGVGGKYFYGEQAWDYIHEYTDINLLNILNEIAEIKCNGAK